MTPAKRKPPVEESWRDDAVAESMHISVVWLRREILDRVPGTCMKIGRSRYLSQRHINKVQAIMEERAAEKAKKRQCRSKSIRGRQVSTTSAGRSKESGWIKAVELATGK